MKKLKNSVFIVLIVVVLAFCSCSELFTQEPSDTLPVEIKEMTVLAEVHEYWYGQLKYHEVYEYNEFGQVTLQKRYEAEELTGEENTKSSEMSSGSNSEKKYKYSLDYEITNDYKNGHLSKSKKEWYSYVMNGDYTIQEYDANQNVIKKTSKSARDTKHYSYDNEYDSHNNLIRVVSNNGKNEWLYNYSPNNLLIKETYRSYTSSSSGVLESSSETSYTYFEDGTIHTIDHLEFEGQNSSYKTRTTSEYDEKGLIVSEKKFDENQKVIYEYLTAREWFNQDKTCIETTTKNGELYETVESTFDDNGFLIQEKKQKPREFSDYSYTFETTVVYTYEWLPDYYNKKAA